VASLRGFGELVRRTFEKNLVRRVTKVSAREVVLDLGEPAAFNVVRLRENIKLGQRVEEFELDAWRDGGWQLLAQGTSIGACRIVRVDATASRVRLRITQTPAEPAVSEIGVYRMAG
jgi:alpha-L-fucosidase